jgi:hypothetical protein
LRPASVVNQQGAGRRWLSGRNEFAQVTVAQERQVGGEQQQPGLGDARQAGPKRRQRSGTWGPLSGEFDVRMACEHCGQIWPGRTDEDEMTGASASRSYRNRVKQCTAANLDRRLVRAAQPAGPAACEHERSQLPALGRQVSRRLQTSAERAGGSRGR